MKSPIIIILIGLMALTTACSKKEKCTCVTSVEVSGQVSTSTSETRELEKDENCELSTSVGVPGVTTTSVVCTLD